jgi:hypothetical protein
MQKYYKNNKQKYIHRIMKWQKNNPKKVNKYVFNYVNKNRKLIKLRSHIWYLKHKNVNKVVV